jgi:hypothetical protein
MTAQISALYTLLFTLLDSRVVASIQSVQSDITFHLSSSSVGRIEYNITDIFLHDKVYKPAVYFLGVGVAYIVL